MNNQVLLEAIKRAIDEAVENHWKEQDALTYAQILFDQLKNE